MVESRSPKPLVLGSSPSAPAKNPSLTAWIFYFWQGHGLEPAFPVGKRGFSDGKAEANRPARDVKSRAALKARFGRVARNTPPGCFALAYLAPLPKIQVSQLGFFIFGRDTDSNPRFPWENAGSPTAKRKQIRECGFFHFAARHNIICPSGQHHLYFRSELLPQRGANERCYGYAVNEVASGK